MSDGSAAPGGSRPSGRRVGLAAAGLVSLALFFVPLVAPFVQLATLWSVTAAFRRREADAVSLAIGAGGALLGLVLHLMTQYVWIV
jgi:hypothetical protein